MTFQKSKVIYILTKEKKLKKKKIQTPLKSLIVYLNNVILNFQFWGAFYSFYFGRKVFERDTPYAHLSGKDLSNSPR